MSPLLRRRVPILLQELDLSGQREAKHRDLNEMARPRGPIPTPLVERSFPLRQRCVPLCVPQEVPIKLPKPNIRLVCAYLPSPVLLDSFFPTEGPSLIERSLDIARVRREQRCNPLSVLCDPRRAVLVHCSNGGFPAAAAFLTSSSLHGSLPSSAVRGRQHRPAARAHALKILHEGQGTKIVDPPARSARARARVFTLNTIQ